VTLVLSIDNVKAAASLLLIAEFLSSVKVGHGRLLGVTDCGINNRFYFIFSCENSLLSGFNGDCVCAWSAPLGFPHMQDVNYWLWLFMNGSRSALLVGRPEFDLFGRGGAESQLFGAVPVDEFLLLLLLNLLIVSVLVEDTGLVGVGIVNAENTVSPAGLDDSVPLSEEYLLGFELIELVELGLDIVEFLPSLAGHSYVPRINHKLRLRVSEVPNLLINRLNVLFPLRFVKQRLLCGQFLESGHSLPFLQR